jgi:hypothetical protein
VSNVETKMCVELFQSPEHYRHFSIYLFFKRGKKDFSLMVISFRLFLDFFVIVFSPGHIWAIVHTAGMTIFEDENL